MNRKLFAWCLCAVLVPWFGAFFVYPLFRVVMGGFVDEGGRFTLGFLLETLLNPIYAEGLLNAFRLAVVTTLLTTIIALPLALLNTRWQYFGKQVLEPLLLVPMILPPFVGALGIQQFLGRFGVLNTLLLNLGVLQSPIDWLGVSRFEAVALTMALHLYPISYLNLVTAFSNIDPAMDEAARNLGANGWFRLRKITIPLVAPGLFAGSMIVFIWSFTELGAPLMFDYTRVTSVQIFDGITELGSNPFPFALVTVLMVVSLSLYGLGKWLFIPPTAFGGGKATRAYQTRRLYGLRSVGATIVAGSVVGIALIPHLGLILMSVSNDWYATVLPQHWTLSHYQDALSHSLTVPSIANSLRYSVGATLIDLIIGLSVAWVIVRSGIRGRWLLDMMVMLPLAVPGLVLAFGYLAITQPGEWFGFLDPTKDPTVLLMIAYAMRRLPYVARACIAGLQQLSPALEEAAHNLGAGIGMTMRRITLPLLSANLVAGGIMAFSFAMLEVSDSLLLAQRAVDFPITKAIYELYNLLGTGRYLASALGVWSMVFLALSLIAAARLLEKKMGALFRV